MSEFIPFNEGPSLKLCNENEHYFSFIIDILKLFFLFQLVERIILAGVKVWK